MSWNRTAFDRLATLFRGVQPVLHKSPWPGPPYSGYKPEVREAPNGDTKACQACGGAGRRASVESAAVGTCPDCNGSGRVPNVDAEGLCMFCRNEDLTDQEFVCTTCGRYYSGSGPIPPPGRGPAKSWLHVADKYTDAPEWAREYHDRAYAQACRVADALGVPAAYYPRPSVGALRVVDYPPGAGTVEHTDFDLFTIVLWRSTPADLERGFTDARAVPSAHARIAAEAISPGLHIGELGELVGLGPATLRRVPARPYAQQSLLYFAIPDHAARLPDNCICPRPDWHGHLGSCRAGQTVGEWLADRTARSRIAAGGYK